MVVFTCNNCGESLKKNQVERHSLQSRACASFSCMDCCRDFTLVSYKTHTSCVSEAQKYQGALYEGPGDGESKGAKKQKLWIEQLKDSIATADNLSPRVSALLSAISDYPNVPRKQKKFENFVSNSLKERNPKIIQQVWEAFSGQSKEVSKSSELVLTEVCSEIENEESVGTEPKIESEEVNSHQKLKKKKRKSEYNSEDLLIPDSTTVDKLGTERKVKKKKRDREETETQSDINTKKIRIENPEIKGKKKKNKHKHLEV